MVITRSQAEAACIISNNAARRSNYLLKKIDASKSNAKATWRVLNEIIKTKKKASKINSIFKVDNQEITDPVDIAYRFCSYFF